MLFFGLPAAGVDETLSSWLFRCSVSRHVQNFKRIGLSEKPTSWWEGLEIKSIDPDVDYLEASKRFARNMNVSFHGNFEQFFSFKRSDVVDWRYRRFFCPDCLRADVANGRLPMWRKSWCYAHSSICMMHGKHLESLNDASRYSKAWEAFANICNSVPRGDANVGWSGGGFWSATVSRVESSMINCVGGERTIQQELFNKLFGIFLQAPYRNGRGGAARINFYIEKGVRFAAPTSLEHSVSIGPSTADPSSRIGSFVLAAILLDALPLSRYSLITKIFEDGRSGVVLPRDIHLAAAFPSVDRVGYQALRRILGYVPMGRFPLLDRHLQLQQDRYVRDGAFDGHSLGDSAHQQQ
ncbi:TniQ family protein [Ectopseudomonas hydrolytica]|uniref:TniQ family protein n=1 Tax=Ectopseudomonas hydrolytica TaxID=2493633 RepID=A0ABY5AE50_9GAMM|nr:TniQ family protein [Pseudomonas hydrolytica]USR42015.1 TniQ family protein [Pseudomonas hydrolytica]